jgi:hypothetical protein
MKMLELAGRQLIEPGRCLFRRRRLGQFVIDRGFACQFRMGANQRDLFIWGCILDNLHQSRMEIIDGA